MKIAIVAACPFPTPQGSQVLIREMAEALHHRGHRVHLVTYAQGEAHYAPPFALHRSASLFPLKQCGSGPQLRKVIADVLLTLTLIRVIRTERIDIIHGHNYEGFLVGLMVGRLFRIPVIYHAHNALAWELETYFTSPVLRSLARLAGKIFDGHMPKRADRCIALCPELAGSLRAGDVAVIPPGIFPICALPDCERTRSGRPAVPTPEDIRTKYGLGSGPLVIYTGNLDAYQDLDLLLQSMGVVVTHEPAAQLLLVTHGRDHDRARALRKYPELPLRLFWGVSYPEARELVWASDVAVLPRTSPGGFPLKLLNYLAAGKAVVAAEGSAKGIRHGEEGLVVKNHDPEAFGRAILAALRDPLLRERLGSNGKKLVTQRHPWTRIVEEIEAVYAATLRNHRAQESLSLTTSP